LSPGVGKPDAPPAAVNGPLVPRLDELDATKARVVRGMLVVVSGTNFPNSPEDISLSIGDGKAFKPVAVTAGKQSSLSFVVPPDTPLGFHTVWVTFKKPVKDAPAIALPVKDAKDVGRPGQLQVESESVIPVKVTSITPATVYPGNSTYTFRVLGEGFSPTPGDNRLVIDTFGEVPVTWKKEGEQAGDPRGVTGWFMGPRQLEFSGLSKGDVVGIRKVQIRVGENTSEPATVTLSWVPRWVPLAISAAVVIVLIGGLYYVVTRGMKAYAIDGIKYTAFNSLFLDKETDTYSLSKLQFYIWTIVAVFGYVYLTVARSMIQWNVQLPPVPENLPGIILISASTGLLARGVASVHGPKASGPMLPSLSDFITTGGVVAPERFQFLVWTVVGAAAFLFLIVWPDPGQLQDLPKIPTEFLSLMGISSFGYLGGKLARKPGPVITRIDAKDGNPVVDIIGRNLSVNSTIHIDGKEIRVDRADADPGVPTPTKPPPLSAATFPLPGAAATGAALAAAAPEKDATIRIVRRDDGSQDDTLGSQLRLTLKPALKDTIAKISTLKITLTNPDGQMAEWRGNASSGASVTPAAAAT
jgi:hypothetical protein